MLLVPNTGKHPSFLVKIIELQCIQNCTKLSMKLSLMGNRTGERIDRHTDGLILNVEIVNSPYSLVAVSQYVDID